MFLRQVQFVQFAFYNSTHTQKELFAAVTCSEQSLIKNPSVNLSKLQFRAKSGIDLEQTELHLVLQ